MADAVPVLERRGALAGRITASIIGLQPAARVILRGDEAAVSAIGQRFGCPPSFDACRAATADRKAALWLGPDEWLLIDEEKDGPAVMASLAGASSEPHSLVDVSHRNTGFDISGHSGPAVLSEGCPLDFDLAAFPVGMCTRTVLAKAEVVLWRTAQDHFRLECWRSFAPYVLAFLTQAIENQD